MGGILCGRNSVGGGPVWEESWWKESHGRNPEGGILHGRNPNETSANIYTCMRLTQKVNPYTLAHLTGIHESRHSELGIRELA